MDFGLFLNNCVSVYLLSLIYINKDKERAIMTFKRVDRLKYGTGLRYLVGQLGIWRYLTRSTHSANLSSFIFQTVFFLWAKTRYNGRKVRLSGSSVFVYESLITRTILITHITHPKLHQYPKMLPLIFSYYNFKRLLSTLLWPVKIPIQK